MTSIDNGQVLDAGTRIRDDAKQLASSVGAFSDQARSAITEIMETRPYVAIAGAAAVGYLLAGGLSSRLTRLGLMVAGRYMIANLGNELLDNVRR